MRISLVISSLSPGGAERVMSTMANYWAEKGHEVALITFYPRSLDFYPVAPGVRRIALDIAKDSSGPLNALINNVGRIRRLRRSIISSRPDIVISFLEKTNILALLATRALGLKLIVSERTNPACCEIGRVWSVLRRVCYPWASAIVAQTERAGKWLEKCSRKGSILVIPNPVFSVNGKKNGGSLDDIIPGGRGSLTVAAVGRLQQEKGFDLLIQAFARVAPAFSGWRLVIFGEGKDRGALERLAGELGIGKQVHFPGQVQNPMALLRQADLFVLSSRYEGFPNALLEAMACGLPVISFDCPSGPREIVRDEVDGILVPAGDVDALARAMEMMMSDEAARKRLGAKAVEVLERFGLEKIMGMWEDLCLEVKS